MKKEAIDWRKKLPRRGNEFDVILRVQKLKLLPKISRGNLSHEPRKEQRVVKDGFRIHNHARCAKLLLNISAET